MKEENDEKYIRNSNSLRIIRTPIKSLLKEQNISKKNQNSFTILDNKLKITKVKKRQIKSVSKELV